MKRAIFTIHEYKENNNAGPKAKNDIRKILISKGYQPWDFSIDTKSKLEKLFKTNFSLKKYLATQDKVDEIYFQYPTYSNFVMKRMFKYIRKYTDAKLILIVHDIESLRLSVGDDSFWDIEKQLLNISDGLIVHNDSMKSWLSNHGVVKPMVSLKLFDYINPQKLSGNDKFDKTINFAGNLSKSTFLNKLSFKDVSLYLFGAHQADHYRAAVHYVGKFPPEELPKHLKQDFGLIWDGKLINTCDDGFYGSYLKYNNPHKVSLYLSSGIPVIIWKDAALAPLIQENHLGILIDDLRNVDKKLDNINQDDYSTMRNNAKTFSKKVRSGFFINHSIAELSNKF